MNWMNLICYLLGLLMGGATIWGIVKYGGNKHENH